MHERIQVESEPTRLVSESCKMMLTEILSRAAASIGIEERIAFGEVTVLIVDEPRISELHSQYFSDSTPTDIITFGYPNENGAIDGDIAICLDVAREQALEEGHSVRNELAFLGVHGLLHLAGWEDATEDLRNRMLERQVVILAEASDES